MSTPDHEHCPYDCEHPQPFRATPTEEAAKEFGLEMREYNFCGRCWAKEKVLTPMVPCAPPFCDG